MDSLRDLDQLLDRYAAQTPGFDPVSMRQLATAWTWEAMRAIESTRLGLPTDLSVDIQNGTGELPNDFIFLNHACGVPRGVTIWRKGWNTLRYACDGVIDINYQAIPTDEDGVPLVMDAIEQSVLAWWEWQYISFVQKKRWLSNANVRIDSGLNRLNETSAYGLIAEARGRLNSLTPADIDRYIILRRQATYRNRRY